MNQKDTTTQPTPSPGDKAPWIEHLIFSVRPLFILVFIAATVFFGFKAYNLRPDASFEKMIPTNHPYIDNYLKNKVDLKGLGNVVRIAVENTGGDIFNPQYLEVLQKINDEVFFIPGVDKAALKSLWTPLTRWLEVTEEGFAGGPVIPDTYDGSEESLKALKINVLKSGEVGKLVSNDFRTSLIYVPLLDVDPVTKEKLDYQKLSTQLETLIRDKYESDTTKIHITGFAKVVGDLIDGANQVAIFFCIAVVITFIMLFFASSCIRSTIIPVVCSITAVIWQLGLLKTFGFGLDPYSMLVPFLIFAIGVSHGVQIINGIAHETMKGADKVMAARQAFRSIYIPGLTALITDGIGFATLMVIQIPVIQDLAIGASIGVAVLILTNLILLPVLMSYSGVSTKAVRKIERSEEGHAHPIWRFITGFTKKKVAPVVFAVAVVLFSLGSWVSKDIQIGDLDPGAPELRPDSRYNKDNAFMNANFSVSTDIFVVMVKTPVEKNGNYNNLVAMDRLQWELKHLPGVQSVTSLVDATKKVLAGFNEGNLKWMTLGRNQQLLDAAVIKTPPGNSNPAGSLSPILIYLNDHKAETLNSVVKLVEDFSAENNTETSQFILAAGNAGIEAATNIVISKAQYLMLAMVFGVVAILCFLTFRSLQSMVSIILPLALTSVLCRVVMMWMDIGVKVATLPVIALGVGVGVDYGIYIFSRFKHFLDEGHDIRAAYYLAMKTTGRAIIFTGITLAIGVGTWVFSPIKFQADMGILLTFMFLVNMIGALTLLPAIVSMWARAKLLREVDQTKKPINPPSDKITAVDNVLA